MKFSDLAGDITPQMEHLRRFIPNWFNPKDIISLVAIPSDEFVAGSGSKRQKVLSQAVTAEDLMTVSSDDIYGLSILDGVKYNLYMGINPLKSVDSVSLHTRGNESEIERVYGVFIDLDVKNGCFSSKLDIQQFLTDFGSKVLAPTIVVDNSESGGAHAYWRFNFGESLNGEEAKVVLQDWWSLIAEHARNWKDGAEVDRLIDLTRVSRLPGGIYWPRKDSVTGKLSGVPGIVSTVVVGKTHSMATIRAACGNAGDRYRETIKRVQSEEAGRKININAAVQDKLGFKIGEPINGRYDVFAAFAYVEQIFNNSWSWENVLEPLGWTFLYEDNQGRKVVARPGRHEKSATVAWPDSPHMMSLLSTSPDTGLEDLKASNIALTKYRVALRLLWNDDETKMVYDIISSIR